jgi:hypothetical protein
VHRETVPPFARFECITDFDADCFAMNDGDVAQCVRRNRSEFPQERFHVIPHHLPSRTVLLGIR